MYCIKVGRIIQHIDDKKEMKTILFYSSVSEKSLFRTQKFYVIDINILEQMGYNIFLSNRIYDALKFWKYDFVFGYFFRWTLFVSIIARLFGKKVYLTGGIDALDRDFAGVNAYNTQKYLFRWCYQFLTKCIIVSPTDLKHVKEILNGNDTKIAYSEHTIETSTFSDVNMDGKENLFITIGWQGHVSDRKGIDKAIILFGLLKERREFSDFKMYILGRKGAYTPVLQKLIDDHNLNDSVFIVGEVSEEKKIDYLKRSKYYFQLSKYEGFGIAALEALVAGNVVLHSGKGGLSNPIYDMHVKVNIDEPLQQQVLTICKQLQTIDNEKLVEHAKKVCIYYDNDRRKSDFEKIIGAYR